MAQHRPVDVPFTYRSVAYLQLITRNILQDLHQRLYDPRYFYAHQWQGGDVVIADNLGLLHGREGFTARSARHIQRVHIQASPICLNPALAPQGAA